MRVRKRRNSVRKCLGGRSAACQNGIMCHWRQVRITYHVSGRQVRITSRSSATPHLSVIGSNGYIKIKKSKHAVKMKKIKHSIKMKKLKDNIRYYCFTHSAVSSHLYLKLLDLSNFSMIRRFLIQNTVEAAPIRGCTNMGQGQVVSQGKKGGCKHG